jgi:palmitoyl-[glycerolipid] 7-desaturase
MLGLKMAKPGDLDVATLTSPPFEPYTPPLSDLRVQQLRPYFRDRTFTDTDFGYAVCEGVVHRGQTPRLV